MEQSSEAQVIAFLGQQPVKAVDGFLIRELFGMAVWVYKNAKQASTNLTPNKM